MNKTSERYNTKIEVPISVILETIFSDDNQDVETLSRWAKKYGFVDLIEKEGKQYYQLQNDYTKQSFYVLLDKEERKQYDYEDYLLEANKKLLEENKRLKEQVDMIYKGKKLKLLSIEKCKNKYCFNYELESGDSNE